MKASQQNSNEILFQKLGNSWFAFTEINDDVIYSCLPDGMDPRKTKLELYEIIEDHMQKVAEIQGQARMDSAA